MTLIVFLFVTTKLLTYNHKIVTPSTVLYLMLQRNVILNIMLVILIKLALYILYFAFGEL